MTKLLHQCRLRGEAWQRHRRGPDYCRVEALEAIGRLPRLEKVLTACIAIEPNYRELRQRPGRVGPSLSDVVLVQSRLTSSHKRTRRQANQRLGPFSCLHGVNRCRPYRATEIRPDVVLAAPCALRQLGYVHRCWKRIARQNPVDEGSAAASRALRSGHTSRTRCCHADSRTCRLRTDVRREPGRARDARRRAVSASEGAPLSDAPVPEPAWAVHSGGPISSNGAGLNTPVLFGSNVRPVRSTPCGQVKAWRRW